MDSCPQFGYFQRVHKHSDFNNSIANFSMTFLVIFIALISVFPIVGLTGLDRCVIKVQKSG